MPRVLMDNARAEIDIPDPNRCYSVGPRNADHRYHDEGVRPSGDTTESPVCRRGWRCRHSDLGALRVGRAGLAAPQPWRLEDRPLLGRRPVAGKRFEATGPRARAASRMAAAISRAEASLPMGTIALFDSFEGTVVITESGSHPPGHGNSSHGHGARANDNQVPGPPTQTASSALRSDCSGTGIRISCS